MDVDLRRSRPAGGTDSRAFCYDDLNRLTWAGTAGTIPTGSWGSCGSTASTTLSGAGYTQAFAYDTDGRLSSGPLGTYSYPAAANPPTAPLHAASSIGTAYTAK